MKLLLLRCMSPELAHSRRTGCRWKGPLLGVNRTKSRVLESTRLTPFGHPTGMPHPVCGRAILLRRLASDKVIAGAN